MNCLKQKRKEYFVHLRKQKRNEFLKVNRKKKLSVKQSEESSLREINNLVLNLNQNKKNEVDLLLNKFNKFKNLVTNSTEKIHTKYYILFVKEFINFYNNNKSNFENFIAYFFKINFYNEILNLCLSEESPVITQIYFYFELLFDSHLYKKNNKSIIYKSYLYLNYSFRNICRKKAYSFFICQINCRSKFRIRKINKKLFFYKKK